MKQVSVVNRNQVRVFTNGAIKSPKWARLVDRTTGKVYTGQPQYIQAVAKRYNLKVNF